MINNKQRFEVFKKYNFTCQYCGRRTPEAILEIDHIIPKSKGGTDDIENLTASCFECNRGKSGTLLDTILKDKDIHSETLLLAERELQLAEYNYIRKKIREREDHEISSLREHFSTQFDYPGYAEREFDKIINIVRDALKFISYVDIMDLIDYSVERTAEDTRGEWHNTAASKYLMGILRNKIKERKSTATEDKKPGI
ncbi:MAG: HNH endonuclease [Dehalococcoidales bacterium]|nr:HNH endonuclease [Dehalococcoidales bacterium]